MNDEEETASERLHTICSSHYGDPIARHDLRDESADRACLCFGLRVARPLLVAHLIPVVAAAVVVTGGACGRFVREHLFVTNLS